MTIWLVSILGRIFIKNQSFKASVAWPTEFPTSLRSLPDGMTRIDVLVPVSLSWKAGQHCYIRLPALSPFDNHPFNITSPLSGQKGARSEQDIDLRMMTFFVRAHQGFTRKLEKYTGGNVDICTSAWLDGPYGTTYIDEQRYETMILIAGGSGITACLAWLLHRAQRINGENDKVSKIKLVWIVQAELNSQWVSSELKAAKDLVSNEQVEIGIYITRSDKEKTNTTGKESDGGENQGNALGNVLYRRPFIPSLLPSMLSPGRNVVIGVSALSGAFNMS